MDNKEFTTKVFTTLDELQGSIDHLIRQRDLLMNALVRTINLLEGDMPDNGWKGDIYTCLLYTSRCV